MANAPKRLKVFQAQFGFYDTVIAAPSQAAALRAWGVHQNLFADGRAFIAEEAQAVEAALANPETPLRRAVGSTDPFALEPANLPKILAASMPVAAKPERKPKVKSPPPSPPADRSALNAAEAALSKLEKDRKAEEAAFRRQQDELDLARNGAQAAYVGRRDVATLAVEQARDLYRKAGGET